MKAAHRPMISLPRKVNYKRVRASILFKSLHYLSVRCIYMRHHPLAFLEAPYYPCNPNYFNVKEELT